jgi:hypothetical protein
VPDQLCLDGLEECLDGGVLGAITLTTHRDLELMLAQNLLIVVRTILAAMDALLSVKQRSEFDLSVCGDAQ